MSRTLTQIGFSIRLLLLGALLAFYGPSAQAGGTCTAGLPTPCASTTAAPGDWSDLIWGLQPPGYPDNNTGVSGLFAELLSPASITLNINVAIEGLVVRPGATLQMTELLAGDLTIKSGAAGQILNEGDILVAADRALSVPGGTVLITGGGRYLADPATGAGTTASLSASDITLKSTTCGEAPEMIISQSMTVTTTTGDLVLDLNGTFPCAALGANAASVGGKTPPILKVAQATTVSAEGRASAANAFGELNIAGSFEMIVAAEVCVGCDPGRPLPIPIVVGADFKNGSTHPEIFNWIRGTLRLTGVGSKFEVGGVGLGAFRAGFSTTDPNPPGLLHTNFSMDHIHIEGDATFINDVANTSGSGPGNEALYVRKLTFGTGSMATTDGSKVYYCELENNGTTGTLDVENFVPIVDCLPTPSDNIPTVSAWGVVILAALLLCVGTLIAKRRSDRIVA